MGSRPPHPLLLGHLSKAQTVNKVEDVYVHAGRVTKERSNSAGGVYGGEQGEWARGRASLPATTTAATYYSAKEASANRSLGVDKETAPYPPP